MAILGGWRITRTGIVFVLGIIVLAAAVFGGIWLVRERGEQARRDEAVQIAQQNLEEQSQTPVNEGSDQTNDGEVAVTDSDDKKDTETKPAASSIHDELPETGIDASTVLIVTLLALSAGYYATSRRAVREL